MEWGVGSVGCVIYYTMAKRGEDRSEQISVGCMYLTKV